MTERTPSQQGRRCRNKGKSGERAAMIALRARGVDCERTREFAGDILLTNPPAHISEDWRCEVKRYKCIPPSVIDGELAAGKDVVVWREDGHGWMVSMRTKSFVWLCDKNALLPRYGSHIVTVSLDSFCTLWTGGE